MEITNDEIAMLFAVGFWVFLVAVEVWSQHKTTKHYGVRKFVRKKR